MVEKIDVSRLIACNEASNVREARDCYLVESLVQQLGVPEQSVRRCVDALYVAFGKGDKPTQRIIEFLSFKITEILTD